KKIPQYDVDVNFPYRGMVEDTIPERQPPGTSRFVMGGVNETIDGQQYALSNEQGYQSIYNLPTGFRPIGSVYMEDNTEAIISVNTTTGRTNIGVQDKKNSYSVVVDT